MKKTLFIALSLFCSMAAYTQEENMPLLDNVQIAQIVKSFCNDETIESLSTEQITEIKEVIAHAESADAVMEYLKKEKNSNLAYIQWILLEPTFSHAQDSSIEKDLFNRAQEIPIALHEMKEMCGALLGGLLLFGMVGALK